MKVIFIDNGVTGTIGTFDGEGASFFLTPVVKVQDYTKAKKEISRIDTAALKHILEQSMPDGGERLEAVLERPLVNPMRFSATVSAVRALEATLTVLETLGIPYRFSDSKDWQRGLLPSSGKKGVDSSTLKQESKDIGLRLFPQFGTLIRKHRDADGILGAYQWWRKLEGKA